MRPTLLLLVLLVTVAGSAAAGTLERQFHERFPVAPGMTLTLEHGDGEVLITAWDRDTLDVEVVYRAEYSRVGMSTRVDFELVTESDDRNVRIAGRESGQSGVFLGVYTFHYVEYTYRIRAPRYVALVLEGEDGDVQVEGWRADIRATSEDGSLALTDVETPAIQVNLEDGDVEMDHVRSTLDLQGEDGDVRISDSRLSRSRVRLEDGSLRVTNSAGDLVVRTEDGSVDLLDFTTGSVSVRTEDGAVDLELRQGPPLDLVVLTEDGNVDVSLEEGTSVTYSLESPDIDLQIPGTRHDDADEKATGTLHGGDGVLRIRTAGGIVLREAR